MTCSFCGKNVTEFRSKFKKLSNNKTKSEKAASASFSETPTLEISKFSEQERELLGSDKVYTLNNSLFYAFRCEHNKSQRFRSNFYQKDARRFICIPWKRSDDDFHGGTS